MLKKLKAWCFHSVTIAWGYLKLLVGALLLSFHEVFDYIQTLVTDPSVKSAMSAMNFPAYVGLGLAVIGCITLAARMRTVNKPTDADNQVTLQVDK